MQSLILSPLFGAYTILKHGYKVHQMRNLKIFWILQKAKAMMRKSQLVSEMLASTSV